MGFGGFGGFGDIGFGSMLGGFGGMPSPAAMMQRMDHMQGMGPMSGGFQMQSSSFSMSSMGGNVQQYQSHTVSSNMGAGPAYSETKQAYSDSSGYQKAGWERHIDNRGHKVVKERRPTERELTHKTFNNIQPEQEGEFNRQWASSSQHRVQAPEFRREPTRLNYAPQASSALPALSYSNDNDATIYDEPSSSVRIDEVANEGPTNYRGPTSRRRQHERRSRIVERRAEPLNSKRR